MKQLLFIVNPTAGRTVIKSCLFEIIETFTTHEYEVTVRPSIEKDDIKNIVISQGNDFDLIVCAGGDGTLDQTVTGMISGNITTPLGYIPCGTTNDFAKSLGIPKDPVRAARRAVKYMPNPIDIGALKSDIHQDYFVYIASFGAFTDVAYSTPQELKNVLGHTAYIMEAVKTITSLKSYHVTITANGQTLTGDYIFAMVCNSLSVGGFRAIGTKDVEFDDGLFEVVLISYPQSPLELQSILTSILMNSENEKHITTFKTDHIEFHAEEAIPWDLDGEYGGDHTDVEIEVYNQALNLVRK